MVTDDLVQRCLEIQDWHKTGLLNGGSGGALRAYAKAIPHPLTDGEKLSMAEKYTADEAMQAIIALSAPVGERRAEPMDTDIETLDLGPSPDLASRIAVAVMTLPWTHGATEDEHAYRFGDVQEAVAKALSAPVEDREIEGLIAFVGESVLAAEIATALGLSFNTDDGRYIGLKSLLRDQLSGATDPKTGDVAGSTITALRSLSARLAEAERERDEAVKVARYFRDSLGKTEQSVFRDARMSASIAQIIKVCDDAEDQMESAYEAAIAERDRLAGLVMKHWKGNCFGGVDHADAREIRAALASRLKAEGGATDA